MDSIFLDPHNVNNIISPLKELKYKFEYFEGCPVKNCPKSRNLESYCIRRFYRKTGSNGLIAVGCAKEIRIIRLLTILNDINYKQLFLCRKHLLEFELGTFSSLNYFNRDKVFF
jgi:hypothetical protein